MINLNTRLDNCSNSTNNKKEMGDKDYPILNSKEMQDLKIQIVQIKEKLTKDPSNLKLRSDLGVLSCKELASFYQISKKERGALQDQVQEKEETIFNLLEKIAHLEQKLGQEAEFSNFHYDCMIQKNELLMKEIQEQALEIKEKEDYIKEIRNKNSLLKEKLSNCERVIKSQGKQLKALKRERKSKFELREALAQSKNPALN